MPFGLCSVPKYSTLADAVEWVLREQGVQFVVHYFASQLRGNSNNQRVLSIRQRIELLNYNNNYKAIVLLNAKIGFLEAKW